MKDIKHVLDELSLVAQAWHREDVAQAPADEDKFRPRRHQESRPQV
jgi:hypothetical protein